MCFLYYCVLVIFLLLPSVFRDVFNFSLCFVTLIIVDIALLRATAWRYATKTVRGTSLALSTAVLLFGFLV